ncbi:2986_t:CDS:1, partial [Gigaspora rosea]
LGLFKDQLRFTIELLKLKHGNDPIRILEELSQIPRYPNLKVFKNGLKKTNSVDRSRIIGT